ncbi:hypothetical protein LDENG_00191690 [Lucifuga dentata]|nr:hypothetical protein LDENG_00191690 [Lucifuga dentata]
MDLTDNTLDVKGKWELEASTIIEDEEWERAWVAWHKCLSSPTWTEFGWKLRMRFFKTPLVIANYDNKSNPLCWRGCGLMGDFSHIFWDCPKIQTYWDEVNKKIGEILNLERAFKPHQLILGNISLSGLGRNTSYMLRVLVLLAHKMITINWLKPHPPTLEQWTQRLRVVNCMENITASLQLRMDIYLQRWTSVILYLAE